MSHVEAGQEAEGGEQNGGDNGHQGLSLVTCSSSQASPTKAPQSLRV